MVEIIPAILAKNFVGLTTALERVAGHTRLVQVDVVDGIFAPNKSWPQGDEARFERICLGDEGLPFWEQLDFQFDLMLEHPEKSVRRFIDAGAAGTVLHAASPGAREAVEELGRNNDEVGEDFRVQIGIALHAGADPSEVEPFLDVCDFVQVMGIEKVGFQKQPFDERALSLLTKIHTQHPELLLQVDGGVSLENIHALAQAGASRVVCGSALFDSSDLASAYRALYTEANGRH
jgi:ribulose-phosphate 3-epimerase